MTRNIDPDFQSPSVLSFSLSFAPSFMSVIASISAFAASTKALRDSSSLTWAAVGVAPTSLLANMTNATTARAGAALRLTRIAFSFMV